MNVLAAAAVLLFSISPVVAQDDEIMGCGGFVKASNILARSIKTRPDFSSAKVKLITPSGIVKSETQSAPNGYYYIPIYDGGEFILKVEGLPGWSFDPAEVPVVVSEGVVSGCEDDVNFIFTGYGVTGRVVGASSGRSDKCAAAPPVGVRLSLLLADPISDGGQTPDKDRVIMTTVSDADGTYSFKNVSPGEYNIMGSHDSMALQATSIPVTVGWANVDVETPLVVKGYPLTGSVMSGSDPVSGVLVLVYGQVGEDADIDCGVLPDVSSSRYLPAATSDETGHFRVPALPCGDYHLVPSYKTEQTTFNVVPQFVEVFVTHAAYQLEAPFQVQGLSLTGKVVNSLGKGINNVKVLLDGVIVAVSDRNGDYRVDEVTPGEHNLRASAKDGSLDIMRFAPLDLVVVKPPISTLPDLVLTEVSISGMVRSADDVSLPSSVALLPRKILVHLESEPHEVLYESVTDPATGHFSVMLPPGRYLVSTQIKASEQAAGLLLSPQDHAVTVSDAEPVTGINFQPVSPIISGTVKCIDHDCGEALSVSIAPIDRTYPRRTTLRVSRNGTFRSSALLPGHYSVRISHDLGHFCWLGDSDVAVQLLGEDVTEVEFTQKGYLMSVGASQTTSAETTHNTVLHTDDASIRLDVNLTTGLDESLCLPKSGEYSISPNGCYQYSKETYTYLTGSPERVQILATHTSVEGVINVMHEEMGSLIDESQVHIRVTRKSDGIVSIVPVQSSAYQTWVPFGETLIFTPECANEDATSPLLFTPTAMEVQIESHECPQVLAQFTARPATVLKGSVQPSLPGVAISIVSTDELDSSEVLTDDDGHYKSAPLDSETDYIVSASKVGYYFQPQGFEMAARRHPEVVDFVHRKLGQINAFLMDGDTPVEGALLTLSGEMTDHASTYRSNNRTNADGEYSFRSLFPGSYHLRPHLKEYTFHPSAFDVEIEEGKTLEVRFNVTRVAYSAMGNLTTLNGRGESGVAVEAHLIGADLNKGLSPFEASTTDEKGAFRIRGLLPNQSYEIFVRDSNMAERITPPSIAIRVGTSDSRDMHFIKFEKVEFGYAVSLRVEVVTHEEGRSITRPDYHSTVTLALAGDNDQVLQTTSVGMARFSEIRHLRPGRYTISLVNTSLDPLHWRVSSNATQVEVFGDQWDTLVSIRVEATRNVSVSEQDTTTSLLGITAAVAVVIVTLNWKKFNAGRGY